MHKFVGEGTLDKEQHRFVNSEELDSVVDLFQDVRTKS